MPLSRYRKLNRPSLGLAIGSSSGLDLIPKLSSKPIRNVLLVTLLTEPVIAIDVPILHVFTDRFPAETAVLVIPPTWNRLTRPVRTVPHAVGRHELRSS